MVSYSKEELSNALQAINSIIYKCEKAQMKFSAGTSQHTLLKNRLSAMYIAKQLIMEQQSKTNKNTTSIDNHGDPLLLLKNIDLLHTTELGEQRIRNNLQQDCKNIIEWCKAKIRQPHASIKKKGKNWYVSVDHYKFTVNAHSYTIITAHQCK